LKAFAKALHTLRIVDPRVVSAVETERIYSEEVLLDVLKAESKIFIFDIGKKGQRNEIMRAIEHHFRDMLLKIPDILPRARQVGNIYAATFRTIESNIASKTIVSHYRSNRFNSLLKFR
jgi:hypothetical protein